MEKKKWFSTKMMAEVGIFAAIAFALDVFQGGYSRGLFVNGGSIGIAMVPILILAYRRGFRSGMLCAVITTFLQMLGGVYAIGGSFFAVFCQICLDYVLAYPAVAIAGVFYHLFQKDATEGKGVKWLIIGTTAGGLLKLLCHYLAGVIFWSSSCPEDFLGGPALYSLVYNGAFMLPNIILAVIILVVIYKKQPKLLIDENNGGNENE